MNKSDLKHMRRSELLEMLLLQSQEIERLRHKIDEMEKSIKSGADPPDNPSNADVMDLIHICMDQGENVRLLREKVNALQSELEKKEILISNAGSIADAAVRINRVFEAAQQAADQYLENVRKIDCSPDAAACNAETANTPDQFVGETGPPLPDDGETL